MLRDSDQTENGCDWQAQFPECVKTIPRSSRIGGFNSRQDLTGECFAPLTIPLFRQPGYKHRLGRVSLGDQLIDLRLLRRTCWTEPIQDLFAVFVDLRERIAVSAAVRSEHGSNAPVSLVTGIQQFIAGK